MTVRRQAQPRADRVLPGVWRLRLPLPWPGVPHGNAWVISGEGGIILVDTGIGGESRLAQLERALAQAAFRLTDVELLVVTHAHTDHYGLAAPIVEAAGCELWMHPAWGHIRASYEDPDAALDVRIEVARQSGVPGTALKLYERAERGSPPPIDGFAAPDRELVTGMEVPSGLGPWTVYETPGHAPSHICLHQPENRLLISGDHLLGRIVVFYEYGFTPDPAGEFLSSLDLIEPLDVSLCLSGHGRPFRNVPEKIAATRAEAVELLERIRRSLAAGPKTAFETVADLIGPDLNPAPTAYALQIALGSLDHLAITGDVVRTEGESESEKVTWSLA